MFFLIYFLSVYGAAIVLHECTKLFVFFHLIMVQILVEWTVRKCVWSFFFFQIFIAGNLSFINDESEGKTQSGVNKMFLFGTSIVVTNELIKRPWYGQGIATNSERPDFKLIQLFLAKNRPENVLLNSSQSI